MIFLSATKSHGPGKEASNNMMNGANEVTEVQGGRRGGGGTLVVILCFSMCFFLCTNNTFKRQKTMK